MVSWKILNQCGVAQFNLNRYNSGLNYQHFIPIFMCYGNPKYSRGITSVSWLLMPYLIVVPGHQQPFYWLHKINQSLSSDHLVYVPSQWETTFQCNVISHWPWLSSMCSNFSYLFHLTTMIAWTIWTSLSAVPRKDVKFNHSLLWNATKYK